MLMTDLLQRMIFTLMPLFYFMTVPEKKILKIFYTIENVAKLEMGV